MIVKSKERIVGVDILKIVAMLLIIIQHILFQGQILQSYNEGSTGYVLTQIIYACTFFSVNCYALASGFLCYKTKYKFSRIIYIWLQTIFFSLIIYFIFLIIGSVRFSAKEFFTYLFPIISLRYWYVSAYFLLFLFIPIFNIGINKISRKTFKALLVSIFILMSVGSILYLTVFYSDPFGLYRGYTVLWLAVLYLFGAYIGKYEIHNTIKGKSVLIFFVLLLCLSVGLRIIFNLNGLERYSDIFVAYISPTNTVLALLFFIICLKIKVRSESFTKILTLLSTTTLGIFLIHAHPLVRSNLTNKLVFLTQYNPIVTCILIIAFGLAVFIVCAIIDNLRSKLFEITKINALTKRIDNKIKFN